MRADRRDLYIGVLPIRSRLSTHQRSRSCAPQPHHPPPHARFMGMFRGGRSPAPKTPKGRGIGEPQGGRLKHPRPRGETPLVEWVSFLDQRAGGEPQSKDSGSRAFDSHKIKVAKKKRRSPECQRFQEVMGRLILLTPKWHSMLQRQRAKGSTAL